MVKKREELRNVSIRDVFEFGEKYKMELVDAFALRKALVLGVVAVEKCVLLGLGNELEADFDEKMNEMMRG